MIHICTSSVRVLPLLCQAFNALSQVLKRGPVSDNACPFSGSEKECSVGKKQRHARGGHIYVRSPDKIISPYFLFFFLQFINPHIGEVSAEPGDGTMCRGARGVPQKSRSIRSGYLLRYARLRGYPSSLIYEVAANVGNLACKCRHHLCHALAVLFDLRPKELVQVDSGSLACKIELKSDLCLIRKLLRPVIKKDAVKVDALDDYRVLFAVVTIYIVFLLS